MLSNKLKNTREITFDADLKTKSGTVIYAKGSTHYVHHTLVEKLKKKGAKFSVKEFDAQKAIEKAKKAKK